MNTPCSSAAFTLLVSAFVGSSTASVTMIGRNGNYANSIRSLSYDGGVAVGLSSDTRGTISIPFIWNNYNRTDLPHNNTNLAHVSPNGQYATGQTNYIPLHSMFRVNQDGVYQNLGQPSTTSMQTFGRGLSFDGGAAIFSVRNPSASENAAYRWSESGGAVNIGHLYASSGNTTPHGISYDGNMIVGESDPGSFLNPSYAFYWTPSTGMQELPMPAGSGRDESGASGVSGNGRVVFGWAPSPLRGVIWRDLVPEWMPILTGGWQGYRSLSINETGDTAVLQVGNIQLQQSANVIYTLQNGIMFAPEFFAMHGITFPETGRLTIRCVSGNGLTFAGSYFDPILGVPTQGIIITIPTPAGCTFIAAACAWVGIRRCRH
jgi:hypothetical protein